MTNIDSKKNLANTILLSTTEPKTVLKVIRSDEHEKKSLRNKFVEFLKTVLQRRLSSNCYNFCDYANFYSFFVYL